MLMVSYEWIDIWFYTATPTLQKNTELFQKLARLVCMTFRSLVWMLYHWTMGNLWVLEPLKHIIGSCDRHLPCTSCIWMWSYHFATWKWSEYIKSLPLHLGPQHQCLVSRFQLLVNTSGNFVNIMGHKKGSWRVIWLLWLFATKWYVLRNDI